MEMYISNNIRIVNPSNDILLWCEKELVIPNPEYSKKLRMGFWLGNTPVNLRLYEKDGDDLILPYGVQSFIPLDLILKANIISVFPVAENVDYHANVDLYDYQRNAVNAMYLEACGILQSPAGSGKTQMGIALAVKHEKRCLWLCHTKDLVNQSKERAERYIDKSLIGTITDGKVEVGKGITFATVQTMTRLDLPKYADIWDVVIVDECHRVAGSPTTVTMYKRVLDALKARYKYGLSATVHRSDGLIKATYCLLGQVAYTVSDEEVADKIMKVGIMPISTSIRISRECLNTDGTLNYTRLITYLTKDEIRNNLIVQQLLHTKGHSVLILSDRLEHLNLLREKCPSDIADDSVMISGKMTGTKGKKEREQALEDMRTGRKHYLFATYSLAKEGLDIPCLDRLFLTTPQKDFAVVTQAIGRIDRKYNGKTDAIAYDFIDFIAYCMKVYRKRWTIYRKAGCYEISDS